MVPSFQRRCQVRSLGKKRNDRRDRQRSSVPGMLPSEDLQREEQPARSAATLLLQVRKVGPEEKVSPAIFNFELA